MMHPTAEVSEQVNRKCLLGTSHYITTFNPCSCAVRSAKRRDKPAKLVDKIYSGKTYLTLGQSAPHKVNGNQAITITGNSFITGKQQQRIVMNCIDPFVTST